MTRKRSSPMGLEILLPVLLAFIMLPLLTQAAPLQDYTEIQQYTEGCYYNYNHYNEGDRIMTNEPCLNCTCHNKMLMCYLRVCPFTKPIGHDCIVEKREDQCCPIITCPEVPVDVAHGASEPGTELSFPEKFGCSIDGKFYLEGAQVPSNPNKPCELCYCIKNRTSCLMQECTLHIDGCTPIYNKGSCCPVRYNCDHENDVLELEDHSSTTDAATTTTTERPTTGFILTSTMTPAVSTDCVHNKEVYADGARILGETACENCYCMRGDIVCAVQECHMPMLKDKDKMCHPLPAAEGECCPSSYVCEDDTTTQIIEATTLPYHTLDEDAKISTAGPVKDLHSAIPAEDLQLQAHIDEEEPATKIPLAEEDKETEIASVRKPIDSGKQQDTEKEATTKNSEYAETTTLRSSVFTSEETKDIVTATPDLSDNLPESTSEGYSSAHDEDQSATTTKSEYPDEDNVKEAATRVPTDTSELPEISTGSADTSEKYTTASSVEDEIEELITTVSVADVEDKAVTQITPTEEKEPENSTQAAEEIKSVADEEETTKLEDVIDVTEVMVKESKPLESDDSATEVNEGETKPLDEHTTKSTLDMESTTKGAGEAQQTKVALSAGEITTENPISSFSVEAEEEPTQTLTEVKEEELLKGKPEMHDLFATEESIDDTTPVPENITPEVADLLTETPKTEDEETETEQSTELSEGKEPVLSTETSVKSAEDKIVSELPSSVDETYSTTTASKIEEEEEVSATSLPTVPSKEESDLLSTAEEKLATTTGMPGPSEDHTTLSEHTKPLFDDDLGSGDDSIEVTPENLSEVSTLSPAMEQTTTISHKQAENEDSEIAKPIASVEGTPTEETESNESSGESAESAESEEDSKLLDLTTAKPSLSDAETSTDENVKYGDKQLEITTTKHSIAEEITEGQEKDTEAEQKPSEAIDSTKTIDVTTVSTTSDDKLPTSGQDHIDKHEEKLFEETESTHKPEDTQKQESEQESDENQDFTEKPDELEYSTTQKSVEEHDQQTEIAQTFVPISEEEDKQIILSESDEEEIKTTARPMVVVEDKTDFTTAMPNAQTDIRREDSIGTEKTALDVKGDFEEKTSTTIRPLVEQSFAEQIPDMRLPSTIPGEGDCLVGEKTFENSSIVPTSDECEVSCKCISSIVVCERVKCEVPENVENCFVDHSSNKKCCPTYICHAVDIPSKKIDTIESTEEEADDKTRHTTYPSTASTELKDETTMKPISHVILPGMSIPEIEMPVVFTEEPMSHVKDEDDVEIQTTKRPVPAIPDGKHDVLVEDHSSATPAVVEDIIIPQSMDPVKSFEQEKHDLVTDEQASHMASEVKPKPEHTVDQEQPTKEVEEHTTLIHESVESTTTLNVHVPSDEKQESEIKPTSIAPATDEYQTVKPLEEEGSGDYKTDIEIQTAMPTSSAADEIYTSAKAPEEHEKIQIDFSTEEDKKPDVPTESTEEPNRLDVSHEDEKSQTQTDYPKLSTDGASGIPDIRVSSELQKEIQGLSTTPAYEISTQAEEQQSSSDVYSKDIIASTTVVIPSKHDINADEEPITFTTAHPSSDDSESETSTKNQTTERIEDTDDALEESTSTTASVTENVPEVDNKLSEVVTEKHDKEVIEPIEEEQEVELSTVASKTEDVNTASPVEIAENELYDHTPHISHEEHKEIFRGPSSTTHQPETQTNIVHPDNHTIVPVSEEYDENKQEDSSSTSVVDQKTTTPLISEDTKIGTRIPIDFEIETSTLSTSLDDEAVHVSTTISSHIEEASESEEKTPDLHSEGSGEQQTESEEITDIAVDYSDTTEQTKKESITTSPIEHVKDKVTISIDHTALASVEDEEATTESSNTLEKLEPQRVDQSTTSPQTSHEHTTEVILSEEDMISVKKDETTPESEYNKTIELSTTAPDFNIPATHVPSKQSSFDELGEASGELVASEEDASTEPVLIHSVSELVTQRVEEETEASGEEGEGVIRMEETTERQHSEVSVTTELPKISDEDELNEVPTDKIPIDDQKSITETTTPSESIQEQTTVKDAIPTTTKAVLDELHAVQQSNKDMVPSISEEDLFVENESTEKPKEIETSTSAQDQTETEVGSTPEIEDQHLLHATLTPTDSTEDDDVIATSAPISANEIERETVKLLKEESPQDEDLELVTEQPEEQYIGISTVKTSSSLDEDQHVTDERTSEDTEVSATTISPISFENIDSSTAQGLDEEKSEEPKIIETVTDKLPSDETAEQTTAHIPAKDIGQNEEEEPTKDIESDTVKIPEIDIISATSIPIKTFDLTTTKPSNKDEGNSDVTKSPELMDKEITSAKLPVHEEEVYGAATTQLPTNETEGDHFHGEILIKATEKPQSEEDSSEGSDSLHVVPEVSTIKLPVVQGETTESPAEKIETEKDQPTEETSSIEKDLAHALPSHVTDLPTKDTKFPAESHEITTELIIEAHLPTELLESATHVPAGDSIADSKTTDEKTSETPIGPHTSSEELPEQYTEMPALLSPVTIQEQDARLTTKKTHAEDEHTTSLPEGSHISTENVPQYTTVAPVEKIETEDESTALHIDAEVTTNSLKEDITESPTHSPEVSVEDDKEYHEHEIEVSEDVHKPTESLPEHDTEIPTKDKQTTGEAHESIDQLVMHATETPSYDIKSEDTYEKHEGSDENHEKSTEMPVAAYDDSTTAQEKDELTTENAPKAEDSFKESSTEAVEDISSVKLHASTTMHPLFVHHSTLPAASIDSRIDDSSSHSTSSPAKSENVFTTSTTTAVSSTTTEPITTSGPHYQPPPPIYGQPPQYGPTQYEDEYTDEDEGEVFGPGTCRYGGKLYVSAQQIPRDDPCDFCFCFRSDIICLQQSCPPPIAGCHEEPISGFCCPRYECPVSMATVLNITTSTTTTSTTLPPHFLHHSYGNNVQRNGCLINGRSYRVGERIESTSGPCINCTCGGDGKMKCDPQACVPEPTMQQVMAVVAAGRKR